MKNKWLHVFVTAGFIGTMSSANAALTEHYGKTISILEASDSPCIFFQLDGVSQANSGISGIWFGIDKNQGNAKEMYAMLLSVKLSGTPLRRVLTNGDVVCGVAKVLTLDL